jgi:hypothetical protein
MAPTSHESEPPEIPGRFMSVPFYERGMGYRRRSIVFEKRLD